MNCPKCVSQFERYLSSGSTIFACGSVADFNGGFRQSTECKLRCLLAQANEKIAAVTAERDALRADIMSEIKAQKVFRDRPGSRLDRECHDGQVKALQWVLSRTNRGHE